VVSVVLTKFAGLSWDGVAFYALAFPLVSTLGALSVKLLARLPHTRYLAWRSRRGGHRCLLGGMKAGGSQRSCSANGTRREWSTR